MSGTVSNFLPFSNPNYSDLGSQTWNTSSQIEFQSIGGTLGLAEAAIVSFTMTVTPTIASGNSMDWSPMRTFANRVTISQGGETYKDIHPFFWIVRNAVMRRLWLPNYANSNVGGDYATSQYAASNLGTTLPALTTETAVTARFTFIIPFRWINGKLEGCFPIGDSSNPLVLNFFTPKTVAGTDPENNLFMIVPNSTDSVAIKNATVKVILVYRTALSYAPNVTIATPVVGTQLKVTQSSIALNNVGSEVTVSHSNRFPHSMILTIVEDGNANPNTSGNTLGLMNAANISRFRYKLTSETPVIDLDTDDKIFAYFQAQRLQLGFDLPDGVFPYFPLFEENGSGYFTDPNLQNLHQIPDLNLWRNTMTGVTVASGTTINASASNIARIRTYSEMVVPVSY